jgi:large subunit ribosomal protein L17
MRHSRVINHLGRTSSHRKAMLANMASSLIIHKRITTTTAKAKALKTYVEPLITKSKDDSTHSRRVVFSYLKDKTAVSELFREVSPKVGERPGGYTRILKIGNRIGDNAEMCILELVDYNETMLGGVDAAKGKTTRRRRSSKKKTETEVPEKVAKTAAVKNKKSIEPVVKEAETPDEAKESDTESEK